MWGADRSQLSLVLCKDIWTQVGSSRGWIRSGIWKWPVLHLHCISRKPFLISVNCISGAFHRRSDQESGNDQRSTSRPQFRWNLSLSRNSTCREMTFLGPQTSNMFLNFLSVCQCVYMSQYQIYFEKIQISVSPIKESHWNSLKFRGMSKILWTEVHHIMKHRTILIHFHWSFWMKKERGRVLLTEEWSRTH